MWARKCRIRPQMRAQYRFTPLRHMFFDDCAHAAARFGLRGSRKYLRPSDQFHSGRCWKAGCRPGGGTAALALASGAAAIAYTLQALGQNGGHFVAQKTIYGGSYNSMEHTLPGFGITASFVNIHDLDEVEAAIQENTRAVYIETLGNPNSDIPDIDALAAPCPQTWHSSCCGQYLRHTVFHPSHRARSGYCGTFCYKISWGHGTTPWRPHCGFGKFRLGCLGEVSGHCRAEPKLSRCFLRKGRRSGRLCHLYPARSCSGTRERPFLHLRRFCCCRGSKRCRSVWNAMRKTRNGWWNF